MAHTFQFEDFNKQHHPDCAVCEELLTDAIDGALTPADEAFFDSHVAACQGCMERLAEARRGAAWLDLLKTQRPEPSAELMERILAQTSSRASFSLLDEAHASAPSIALPANVIPFTPRPVSGFTRLTRLAMEPRFAMTAAMAFFSIALTLDLTGVRLDQLHASDLRPSSLKRTYYEANASAVRYYDNLRVVHVLESRVQDLRQSEVDDRIDPHAPAARPRPQQDEQKKRDVPPGSSRREQPLPAPAVLQSQSTTDADRFRLNTRGTISAVTPPVKTEGGMA